MGVAERLYFDAAHGTEFEAEVTDIREERRVEGRQRWQMALDRTAFYPEGGGQPSDTGAIEAVARSGARIDVPVLGVEEDAAGEVWHAVEKPLAAGTRVTGRVDTARRTDHAQQHTGQHLLSAVFLRELGMPTVSFHMGQESSTIDLAAEGVSRADLVRVEEATNALIAEDRAVTVGWVERAEAEAMLAAGDLRKLPEREGPIRLIGIEGVEWNACGGTHVTSTGRIGGLTLRRTERVRQGVRVEFCCGVRAVRRARRDYELLREMGDAASVGVPELPAKLARMLEEAKSAGKERRDLLEQMAEMEARLTATGLEEGTGFAEVQVGLGGLAYAKLVAARLVGLRPEVVAVVSAREGERVSVVMARGADRTGVHCGDALREVLAEFGAKGGGSAELAQGAVPEAAGMMAMRALRLRVSGG